jgi:hypothetical protein
MCACLGIEANYRRGERRTHRQSVPPPEIDSAETQREARCEAFVRAQIAAIGRGLVPVLGTPGERFYRETRCIDTDAIADVLARTDAIGWHPLVRFDQPNPNKPLHEHHGKRFGCIVAIMTDPVTAELTGGISRTYITADLKKLCKAKNWGRAGIVRLDEDASVTYGVGLLEGLEKALKAMARGFRPCWSTGGKRLMADFPLLPAIQSLTLFADHDEDGDGLRKAQEAQARYLAAGREARVFMTKELGDLNDLRDEEDAQ